MRLPKHLVVAGAVAIAMAATTAVALGAIHTTRGAGVLGTELPRLAIAARRILRSIPPKTRWWTG